MAARAKGGRKAKKKTSAKKPLSGIEKKTTSRKQPANSKRKQAEQIILATIVTGIAGLTGYFGWRYIKKRMTQKSDATTFDTGITTPPVLPPVAPPVKEVRTDTGSSQNKSGNDDFPLKKGSKGERVKALQVALIGKYGSSALPKYGADGDFGAETANALKKNGLPEAVNESTYNLLIQSSGVPNASVLAQKLFDAAASKNFNTVMSLLQNLKSKQDYQQVSNSFLQKRLRGVRQTLVNGLLSSFSDAGQKQKIGVEFVRMGLQYDGNKFSLAGFDGKTIITKAPATIWVSATQSVQVPASMVLGNEVAQRLDYTLFENNNKYFLIKTESIKYL